MALESNNIPPGFPEDDRPVAMDSDYNWPSSPSTHSHQGLRDNDTNYSQSLEVHVYEDIEPEDSAEWDAPKYQLRPQARNFNGGFHTTWIDQDQTGDYDPSEESRQARLRRNRPRMRRREVGCLSERCADENHAGQEATPLLIPSVTVNLSFASEAGKNKFAKLVNDLPLHAKGVHGTLNGYGLRKRHQSDRVSYSDDRVGKQEHVDDSPVDPTGHPFARGCWNCATLGHECSLLSDEYSWPCAACLEDGENCYLVTQPDRKRACEHCKSRRTACSYSYTLNHGVACQQCAERGQTCIAGPTKDAIRTRIRYDRDWLENPIPAKKAPKIRDHAACAECRAANQSCTFQSSGNCGQPCHTCVRTGAPCTVESLVPQQRTKRQQVNSNIENQVEELHETGQEFHSRQVQENYAGVHKTIETKFCHPILFNHEVGACHFCNEPAYGILGLGLRKVEVIDWSDGRGLEEVSGGHRGDGVENTRVCPSCTLAYLSVMMCNEHKMRPTDGPRKNVIDENAAVMELLLGASKAKERKWCSICPGLASYECCQACGLRLCKHCQLKLAGTHRGDLQQMLLSLKDKPSEGKMLRLRADSEFLKQDGMLMRFLIWSSQ